MLFEKESRESNHLLVSAAYMVWLTPIKRKDSFNDYCKMLGLVEADRKLTNKEIEIIKEKSDKLAERIMSADKKRISKT